MENKVEWLTKHLSVIYEQNPYVKLLDMSIVKLDAGYTELSMPIIENKHTNLYQIAHGGALASLADTIMGVACATLGKKVVTLEMNINFIKAAAPQAAIIGIGNVIHNGKNTMVAEGKIIDGENNLLATSRGTFFVMGEFEEMKDKDDENVACPKS
ncbi:PaaI family thioesterase [Pelosinus sp. sgz500959]|uniref:PaaI family thioesterase n=1 Tax=Pelosinus sp. sgz500959 TaxID=3242472 RepID=UPI00366E1C3E